jgi:hypothetical protein
MHVCSLAVYVNFFYWLAFAPFLRGATKELVVQEETYSKLSTYFTIASILLYLAIKLYNPL